MGGSPGGIPDVAAAYGGEGWMPRPRSLREEEGDLWGAFGQSQDWTRLRAVLLHHPGPELDDIPDPSTALMLARPDPDRLRAQHDGLAEAYREAGVEVHLVNPPEGVVPPPNLMYVADLFFMTPEGAILARPASATRAGEERWVQRRLADLGVPILRAVGGRGVFEGADAMWIDEGTVLLAEGLRTNREGADQVATVLNQLGVAVVRVALPPGTMHLMGQLRLVDRDLAIYWEGRFPEPGPSALEKRGFRMVAGPDETESRDGFALNFVTVGPREIVMSAGCPISRSVYGDEGITCHEVEVSEITRAAGGIGCLTGILKRD
jgi:arginine deiminase